MAIGSIGPQLPLPPTYKPPLVGPPAIAGADDATGGVVGAPFAPPAGGQRTIEGPGAAANSFSRLLNDAVGQIDKLQKGADSNIQKLPARPPAYTDDLP